MWQCGGWLGDVLNPMKLLPWMCQNHMMGSAGVLVIGEHKNMLSILGVEPLKSLAMSILQE